MLILPLEIFIVYAREDRPALDTLMGHLAVFERNGMAQFWYDRAITGGMDWNDEMRFNLKTADIVALLISPDFFRSDYIHSVELTEALQRDRAGEALVVPLILKKCLWHRHAEIARLQALPSEAKPVFDKKHWLDPDDGFYDIAAGFDRILNDPATVTRLLRKYDRIKQEQEVEKLKREEAARQKCLPEMVFVQGGTFLMYDESVAEPPHAVTLSDFEIGRYPVTQRLWQEIMDAAPSHFKDCAASPVEKVSWNEVQEFLKKLNARFPGKNFRLPTEAEWEYAARGGRLSKGFAYSGSNDPEEVAWFEDNSGAKTHPVGRKKANELGLHDMSGNVWEWCQDWYGDYPAAAQNDPKGPREGSYRVLRGGSWRYHALYSRASSRYYGTPDGHYYCFGFRLASSPQ